MNPFQKRSSDELKELLSNVKTIAVIGCSSNPNRTSYHIAEYLMSAGFTIYPVNPNESEVLGRQSYPSLDDLPENISIDLIDIFRNKRYVDEVVEEIISWSKDRGEKPVIWTQLDVSTDSAKELAEKNGFKYVENRCVMVEHR
ncbi:CoA-binding protein [Rhodohalobacter mucosus]|uniref:CoA-binding protein n=1 Tax=Rhodohalobacter mucosus TaxID=2079485 RepID=UPI001304DBF7|nr:CoA-binding protein [Rhodohalobacter mucosus]